MENGFSIWILIKTLSIIVASPAFCSLAFNCPLKNDFAQCGYITAGILIGPHVQLLPETIINEMDFVTDIA